MVTCSDFGIPIAPGLRCIFFSTVTSCSDYNCGSEITELEGTIESPGHPQQGGADAKYEPNLYCHWWYDGDDETLVLVSLFFIHSFIYSLAM